MALSDQINTEIKLAMKAKDKVQLESLRAIKSALLLAATEKGSNGEPDESAETKILQKLVKQRKDAAEIFRNENRIELAEAEEAQIEIIAKFLPEQLGEEQIRAVINRIVTDTNASSMKDMGRVMGIANKELAGKADGKLIANIVKTQLS
ncbi:MAG: glutamyl-tRNA amidotransferase [Verrucomicrobia bacterium]|nr:glutamyl-tRNA amidotransferase [Verrucomicrobiota bacterium]|tara:strand:- start:372 stop:821 length:450 start_codon:yes stop_codon:yes gene_type:complete